MMKKVIRINKKVFLHSLNTIEQLINKSINNWRSGNDHLGLEEFKNSLNELEKMMLILNNNHFDLGEQKIALGKIIQELERMIDNHDIIGLTDILEFQLLSFINTFKKDVDS